MTGAEIRLSQIAYHNVRGVERSMFTVRGDRKPEGNCAFSPLPSGFLSPGAFVGIVRRRMNCKSAML
jgi:hypothetical protein